LNITERKSVEKDTLKPVEGKTRKYLANQETIAELQSPLLQKYLESSHQIVFTDSRNYRDDPNTDFVKKRLFVSAEYIVAPGGLIAGFELVVSVDAEVCTSADESEDDGFITTSIEVYRIPFINNRNILASIFRGIRKYPKFFESA
jgi:hypothetical protein